MARLEELRARLREHGVSPPSPGVAGEPTPDPLPPCGAALCHSLDLASAYGPHCVPTHCVAGYANALDWICFSRETLRVVGVAPLPPIDELRRHVAIPSAEFPSDHVSLVADLEFYLRRRETDADRGV